MKLDAPFIQLPISFDAQRLAEEVSALGESAWRPHPQNFPGNSMLPLVAINGDPGDERFRGSMQATPHLSQCPYLMQVLSTLGATVGRTRLMRLSGGAEVARHVDQGYYWAERVRVHVPIVTQPNVRFECGKAAVNMAAGECWIFDTWRQHRVLNDDSRSRIHLVCDTVGGEKFWEMVKRGNAVDEAGRATAWSAMAVPFQSGHFPEIAYESHNLPAVMSPWELRTHLEFLLDEAVPSPELEVMRRNVHDLYRSWLGLWAKHADADNAEMEYRQLLGNFIEQINPFVGAIALRNEMAMFPVLIAMVAQAAAIGPRS